MDRVLAAESEEALARVVESLSEDEVTAVASHSLDLFTAANFCGYEVTSMAIPEFLTETAPGELAFLLVKPFPKARCLGLLLLCKRLAEKDCFPAALSFRLALLWQAVLGEPVLQLKEKADQAAEKMLGSGTLTTRDEVVLHLERAHNSLILYDYETASDSLEKAIQKSSLGLELTGKMGKRTRFQVKELAQLVLQVNLSGREKAELDEQDLPVNCGNQDDTLLPNVSFAREQREEMSPNLSALDCAILVTLCHFMFKTEHRDDLLREKCDAYLAEVLRTRRGWAVHCSALLLRCDLERSSKRRVERAASQVEALHHLVTPSHPSRAPDQPTLEIAMLRVPLVLASGLVPFWKTADLMASILRTLGCTSEALLCYESLEMWDSVVECFSVLGQLEKAEGIVRRLLSERGEEPNLLCTLGDITRNEEYYNRSVEKSSDSSSRARKSLGMAALLRKDYSSAFSHLRRSLELQPIQLGVWYNAGFCAWQEKQWAEAVAAFHRCVSLEPEHGEAWNNLSAAYIRLGQKERARRILQEALRFNFSHAKVWETYVLLCVDTSETAAAIAALNQLADLGKPYLDDEVLEVLGKQVALAEGEGEQKKLREELCKVLSRLSSSLSLSPRQWRVYADLKRQSVLEAGDDHQKFIQLLERALLADSNKPGWQKQGDETGLRTLRNAGDLAEARLQAAKLSASQDAVKQARSRVRMGLRLIVAPFEREDLGPLSENVSQELERVKDILAMVL